MTPHYPEDLIYYCSSPALSNGTQQIMVIFHKIKIIDKVEQPSPRHHKILFQVLHNGAEVHTPPSMSRYLQALFWISNSQKRINERLLSGDVK